MVAADKSCLWAVGRLVTRDVRSSSETARSKSGTASAYCRAASIATTLQTCYPVGIEGEIPAVLTKAYRADKCRDDTSHRARCVASKYVPIHHSLVFLPSTFCGGYWQPRKIRQLPAYYCRHLLCPVVAEIKHFWFPLRSSPAPKSGDCRVLVMQLRVFP